MQNQILRVDVTYSEPLSAITEPVSLTEVKTHLEITNSDDDDKLTDLIHDAREYSERLCSVSLVPKTIVLITNWYYEQELPYAPIGEVTSVRFRNSSGVYEVTTGYTFDNGYFSSDLKGRFEITYTAGTASLDLSNGLKLALLNMITAKYENRGDVPDESSFREMFLPYVNYSNNL